VSERGVIGYRHAAMQRSFVWSQRLEQDVLPKSHCVPQRVQVVMHAKSHSCFFLDGLAGGGEAVAVSAVVAVACVR